MTGVFQVRHIRCAACCSTRPRKALAPSKMLAATVSTTVRSRFPLALLRRFRWRSSREVGVVEKKPGLSWQALTECRLLPGQMHDDAVCRVFFWRCLPQRLPLADAALVLLTNRVEDGTCQPRSSKSSLAAGARRKCPRRNFRSVSVLQTISGADVRCRSVPAHAVVSQVVSQGVYHKDYVTCN